MVNDNELCKRCGFTYSGHVDVGNTGMLFPCWTPSGRIKGGATDQVTKVFTDDELFCVKSIAHNWAIDMNRLEEVFTGLHRKMSEMIARPPMFVIDADNPRTPPLNLDLMLDAARAEGADTERKKLVEMVKGMRGGHRADCHNRGPSGCECGDTVDAAALLAQLKETV